MPRRRKSHNLVIGYAFWIIGFMGAHRFYYGKKITGAIWACTVGLLGIGWIIDLFLIPGMCDDAQEKYKAGNYDYSVAWLLLVFIGYLGFHRFYMGKLISGLIYLCTLGILGLGVVFDVFTLNEQLDTLNRES